MAEHGRSIWRIIWRSMGGTLQEKLSNDRVDHVSFLYIKSRRWIKD